MLNEYVSAIQGRRALEIQVQNPRSADNLRKYKKKLNPKNKDFKISPLAQMKVNYKDLIIEAFYMYIYELNLI